ncbi:sensor histidine kinase [Sunxiuqinia sp. A32]|uniref:sensor histidine kinase n=1 Tax=Sunxiuqinia sp. A32 TaxID=3461496 RepID=UPI004045F5DD
MQNQARSKSIHAAENLILIIFWLIIFSAPIIFIDDFAWEKVFHDWQRLLPFLVLALANHFVLVPVFFLRKKKQWYFVLAFFTLVSFTFIMAEIRVKEPLGQRLGRMEELQHPQPPPRLQPESFRPDRPMPGVQNRPVQNPAGLPPNVNAFLIAMLILGFDTGLRSFFRWTKSEQEKETLEKENVKSELAFLRNQVSPHFFMNTLNNIHALIDIDPPEAKESIIGLSKLMRHLLYESEDEKVSLKKEVEFLQHYVDLMKLRFPERVKVNLELPETLPELGIPPMLFTSFIENAFKHGVSYNAPSFINISIKVDASQLIFEIQNSNFSAGITSKASGIGLANIRKRLDLLYPDSYKLEINNQRDIFVVNLSIPI